MHPLPKLIRISLPLSAVDYRVYVSAVRKLKRIMGRQAPDILSLIRSNLHDRDAAGVADDYLDSIRWPDACGRMISLVARPKTRRRKNSVKPRRSPKMHRRLKSAAVDIGAPTDPSRN